MDSWFLLIPGPPVAKGRARIFGIKTKSGGVIHRGVTPPKTASYETLIRFHFSRKYPDFKPLDCAVSLSVVAAVPIPSSFSKKKRQLAIDGKIRPETKPDWDNYGKIVDALNGIAWDDDKRIVHGSVDKVYDENPHMSIMFCRYADTL